MSSNKLFPIHLRLNGESVRAEVKLNQTLLSFLRDELHQWEVKNGCGKGDCGSCTILVDGVARHACLMLAVQADDTDLLTAQGLGDAKSLHPLQKAFIAYGAIQCGFCTPGMLLAVKELLDHNSHPTRGEIRAAISGNLCRCTGYQKIIDAVKAVS